MLKFSVTLFALLVSTSAFAAPSWIICIGPRHQARLLTSQGNEELYFGAGKTTDTTKKVESPTSNTPAVRIA